MKKYVNRINKLYKVLYPPSGRRPAGAVLYRLVMPLKRAGLALLAIVLINIVVGITLGNLLPAGELPTPPGTDLAVLAQLTLIAAVPE